jgi:DNA invertase Pin-like site-specific DNA recombinase
LLTFAADVHGMGSTAGGEVVAELVEVETGKNNARPKLAEALAACRAMQATLIVAKLDRLARNAEFLLSVVRESGEGGVVFTDLPQLPAGASGKFILTLFAAVAELEAGLISQRTRAALTAAKARGVKLGNPNLKPGSAEVAAKARAARAQQALERVQALLPYITAAKRAGASSLREIALAMEARGIRTPSGRTNWHPATVLHVLRAPEPEAATLKWAA